MLLELTSQEVMLLKTCLEYRQRDYMQIAEMYEDITAREYDEYCMFEMTALVKKLEEVV